jgi:hypothetical protein
MKMSETANGNGQAMAGGCLCGSVKFTATGVGGDHGVCHCGTCRKWSGGPTMAIHVEGMEFENEDNVKSYVSSDWAERGFCQNCGTHLFYRLRDGSMTVVWAGAFDKNDGFSLANEIYIDSKPAGYNFAGDHPRMTEHEFLKSLGMVE